MSKGKTVSVRLAWNRGKLRGMENEVMKGIVRMGSDIATEAREKAPYKTGALSDSIRIESNGDEIWVIAGGRYKEEIRYAAVHEFGGGNNIKAKHYMENARTLVMSGDYLHKYFGGIT